MGGSSGTSTGQQTQTQSSKTKPWAPTIPALNNIIGQISGQLGNTGVTEAETTALNNLANTAQQGNPYATQIAGLADDLLAGGGPDRSGIINDAYAAYQQQQQPFLSADYLSPYSNPAFAAYNDTVSNDVQSRVNSMFAGAGRDLSGMNVQTLARGIAEGTAPIYANQYNQNVATQRAASNDLFQAGLGTASSLMGMDQAGLANRIAGVGAAEQANAARDSGDNMMLQIEALRRGLPLQNIAGISQLLLPIAGLGQQSSGTATTNTSQTMSPVQQFAAIAQGIGNLGTGFANGAKGAQIMMSDRRLKDEIKAVGKLDNGLTVYSYRYKAGGPIHIGLMADEVERLSPDAVVDVGGYKAVDYSLAVGT